MSSLRKKMLFLGMLTTSLVVSGCNASSNKYEGPKSTENLLQSDEEKLQQVADADDPVAAHMRARAQVDPRDTRTHHAYTTQPTAEEIDRETNVRVVELERQPSSFKKLIPNLSPSSEEAVQVANAPHVADTMPDTHEAPVETIIPAAGGAMSDVTGVRFGQYPQKTRMVLDVSAPSKFSYNLNASGTVLTVHLPHANWTAATQKSVGSNGMIKGYSAQAAQDGGVLVNIELSKPGRLVMKDALPANDVYGNRIVFDVAPL